MKKTLKVLAVLVVLLVGVVIALPFIFKSELVDLAKAEINNAVDAKVTFGDFDISLFSSFPDLNFEINDVRIDGEGQFDNITLASMSKMNFDLDVMSVISGNEIMVNEVNIDQLKLNALVLEDGQSNYEIMNDTTSVIEETEDTESTKYQLRLDKYTLTNSEIIYDNRSLDMYVKIAGLNHSGSGDLSDEIYALKTITTTDKVDITYEGVGYIREAEAEINADLDITKDFTHFVVKGNEIRLNNLFLTVGGAIDMPRDGIDFDLEYAATKTDLKNILSLIPREYMSDLAGLETKGSIDLNGKVFGSYDDENLPGFSVNFNITDGNIQYPDLPESIDDIQSQIAILFPGGTDFDAMTLDVKKINLLIAESPISARIVVKNPISDPLIDMNVDAQIDLARIKEAVTLESIDDLKGIITADVDLKGRVSSLEKEQYQDFNAKGKVVLQDMVMRSDSMPDVLIDVASLDFTPQALILNNLESKIGKSDFKVKGTISNYLAYYLKDEPLKGVFSLVSNVIDLNEFMSDDEVEESSAVEASGAQMEMLEVPKNLDIKLNSTIGKVIYDNLNLDAVKGDIIINDGQASMNGVTLNTLGGSVIVNGLYSTETGVPAIDFDYKIKNMDIKSTATAFNTVEKLAPIAKRCTGKFSSDMKMKMTLDKNMNPQFTSISGDGDMNSHNVFIEGFKPLNKIAEALKIPGLSKQNIQDIAMNFIVADGKVIVKPFTIDIDGIPSRIEGNTALSGEMDYLINMKIPMEKLGSGANDILGSLVGNINNLGLDLSVGQVLSMNIAMTGTVDDPKIKPSIIGAEGQSLQETIVETITEQVNEIKDEAIEDAKEDAREEAAKIIAEAEKQADLVKAEAVKAGDRVRAEAKRAGDKLIKEAGGNPIAKIAAKKAAEKFNKEGDKKAKKIVSEANKRADKIIADAKIKADQKLQ